MKLPFDRITPADAVLLQDFASRVIPFQEELARDWSAAWLVMPSPGDFDPDAYRMIIEHMVRNLVRDQLDCMSRGQFEEAYEQHYRLNRRAARGQYSEGGVIVATQRHIHALSRASQAVLQAWVDRLYADEPAQAQRVQLAQERFAAQMSHIVSEAYSDEHEAHMQRVSRQLRQALDQTREALLAEERANRAKSEFVAAVSHEIRSPLNAILGYISVLRDETVGTLTSEQNHFFERLEQVAHATHRLTDDLLENARLEAGKLDLAFEAVDVAELLAELRDDLGVQVEGRAIAVALDVADGLPPLWADRSRARQILANLTSNAAKFTQSGCITIAGGCTPDRQRLCLSVRDTGSGVHPDDLPHLFELFYRGQGSQGAGGAGIGLFLSRQLAQHMGGDIDAASQLGKGSCFTLTLPARS